MTEAENVADQQFTNITYQFNILSPERDVFIGSSLATFDLCTLATEFFAVCGTVDAGMYVYTTQDTLPSYSAPSDQATTLFDSASLEGSS